MTRTLFRLLTVALLAAPLAGCVVVMAPPLGWLNQDNALQETTLEGTGAAKVLVLSVDGFISDEPSDKAFGLVQEESTLARVAAELRKAGKDDAVKAIVLRLNSPGGGVTASDEIYQRLRDFADEHHLPVIASMGSLAASGAYYVACSADTILAQPTTVTGSIGVILVGVNIAGLMDKIGVADQTITSGPHKDLLSPLKPADPADRAIVQGVIDHLYQRFVHVVQTRRPDLASDRLAMLTDGRVFDAADARQYGLVDRIGRIHDAIDLARTRIGAPDARVVAYHRPNQKPETVYSAVAGGAAPRAEGTRVDLAPVRLSLSAATSSQFLYLWRPGLSP